MKPSYSSSMEEDLMETGFEHNIDRKEIFIDFDGKDKCPIRQ